ncbi:mitochondrial carrier domain-containing protein [Scenedesmus sp. NREL 46B-D3]|nr:mitochondrial carrier domain-containing protein [Scenedesmus sp. NREL 46B-D3]
MTRLVREADAQRDSRLLREFAASGMSVGCANTFLNPVEVVKTRMQLAGTTAASTATATATAPPPAAAAAAASTAARTSAVSQAAAAAYSTSAAAGAASSGTAQFKPSAARFISHSSSAAAPPATLPLQHAGQLPARSWVPQPAGAAPAAAAAAAGRAAAPAEAALAAAASAITGSSSSSSAATAKRPGFLATAGLIYRQEGASAFTRGIQASATRAVCNGGIRLGMYDPIKGLLSRDGTGRDLHVGLKLAAGSISGGIGAVLTTPIELAKTRLQAPSATTRSMSAVLRGVVAQRGVAGLWSGASPSVLRLVLLNSSMVATYDEVKGRIARLTGWTNGVQLVLSSSMVAGVVTTTVINPADVIRAYMQTGRGSSFGGVARGIYAAEGARGFLKGWTAAYARTGPQTLIIFTVSEVMRPLFGLAAIGGSA